MMPMIASPRSRARSGAPHSGTAAGRSARVRTSHFQHDAGQHDGTGGGRFHVRVGQPGVQREQRDLDGEREEECQEEQHLFAGEAQAAALRSCRRMVV